MWRAESHRAKPDHSEPDHTEPNQGLYHQIMWDLHSTGILHSAKWQFLTDILRQPTGPIFRGQEIKNNEHIMTDINWNKIFLGLHPSPNFLKMYDISVDGFMTVYRERWTKPDAPLRLSYSQSLGTTETNRNLLRYAPEDRSIPRIKGKGKGVPSQAQCGPEGSRRFRLPDFYDIQYMKVARL